ncbi:MAG: DUF1593 domain-containing protein [Saprospiraceae bacterium]|nr:DUF1593 domain-containing protein [Saprospiraceae bacterium]
MPKKSLTGILLLFSLGTIFAQVNESRPRIIVTSDGEIDDECSMVRFLLYANEFEIEGIVTSSSQYHWHGHNWAGDDWLDPYLEAYSEVYPNLILHDVAYPSPGYLKSITFVGNVQTEGEMHLITPGSQHIVRVLLDESDDQPIWIQAWGGINTIARALKTIELDHPDKMQYVADKIRFFFIWEQDSTYQSYIRPNWGKHNIQTIISDQFEAIAYRWKDCQPGEMHQYYVGSWMKENILEDHGALCARYRAHNDGDKGFEDGDFRSEGDSPAFIHQIPTGLRNLESPGWGGWGGRYVWVRDNTWLDPVPIEGYVHPDGRWYSQSAWGRISSRNGATVSNSESHKEFFRPIWRWSDAFQNDFAARADWCVRSYEEANHPPIAKLAIKPDITATPGSVVELSAVGSDDPDGDQLIYHWWHYKEASSFSEGIQIKNSDAPSASVTIPKNINEEATIHIVCEVKDSGTPSLTRYQRVIINVKS